MKKNRDIPKTFSLGGYKYKVIKKKKVVFDDGTQRPAVSNVMDCTVEIADTMDKNKLSSQYQRQTFYHELVHQILDVLDETDLSENETFVQKFSLLLDQFEQTKKF